MPAPSSRFRQQIWLIQATHLERCRVPPTSRCCMRHVAAPAASFYDEHQDKKGQFSGQELQQIEELLRNDDHISLDRLPQQFKELLAQLLKQGGLTLEEAQEQGLYPPYVQACFSREAFENMQTETAAAASTAKAVEAKQQWSASTEESEEVETAEDFA